MRTPWKVLYDWSNAIIGPDLGPGMWRVQSMLWMICVGAPIAIIVWAASALVTWIAPTSELSRYIEGHYWPIVIILAVLFFFYLFFRMVWDGLKEPTAGVSVTMTEAIKRSYQMHSFTVTAFHPLRTLG